MGKLDNIYFEGKPVKDHIEGETFNVCYLREYMDPENPGDFFYAYETVYRNVPNKFKKIFTDKVKLKIVKFLDWNYKETATNYAKVSKVELINEKQYYQTYEDVFGETAQNDKMLLINQNSSKYMLTNNLKYDIIIIKKEKTLCQK